MNDCDSTWKERLADVASGRANAAERARVEEHVRDCADCADESALLTGLAAHRPRLSADLAARIGAGVREGLRADASQARPPAGARRGWGAWLSGRRVPAWALAAAAVVVLALGTPSMVQRMRTPEIYVEEAQMELDSESTLWVSDDPLVAGAPVLDGLSDEQLSQLLEEMGG